MASDGALADGRITWSVPVQVNADHNVPAFTPTIHVRADGVIGVTYYDLRNGHTSPASLLNRLLRHVQRRRDLQGVTPVRAFDLDLAAEFRKGCFSATYESLASTASGFSLYVQPTPVPSPQRRVHRLSSGDGGRAGAGGSAGRPSRRWRRRRV